MATNIADVVLIGGVAAIGMYYTNFMGFREWVTTQLGGSTGGGGGGVAGNITDTGGTSRGGCDITPCKNQCVARYQHTAFTINPKASSDCKTCYCNPTLAKSSTTTPTCTQQCANRYPGRTPRVTNGICYCDPKPVTSCPPCAPCYVRSGVGCTCKFNELGILHNDQYCKTSCGGVSCWTNYPCPNLGARAQKCVKGTCTQARAAWLATYGCKSAYARSYSYYAAARTGDEYYDEEMERVPTIAGAS
jgi:hypothetical protein